MSEHLHPDGMAIRRELEQRFSREAWDRLTEAELDTITAIIQGRCRKVAHEAVTEFAVLTSQKDRKATG